MFMVSSVKFIDPESSPRKSDVQQEKPYKSRLISKQRLKLLDLRKELKH